MTERDEILLNVTTVAIGNRALMLAGESGSGKSSLALTLIDRGAMLIGDDGVTLRRDANQIVAAPPPHQAGKLEIRNVGLVDCPIASAPLALILTLTEAAERFRDQASHRTVLGIDIPAIEFWPGMIAPAVRAEWALARHGLAFADRQVD